MSEYVTNSLFWSSSWINFPLIYGSIIFSIFIIIHSAYVNGRKYHSVRLLTEVASWSFLFLNICLLLGAHNPTELKTAVVIDVFGNGVFGGIVLIQLCDNYMFYNRYLCISIHVPLWKRYLVHAFIWLVLMATWLPQYTVFPLGINTNSARFTSMQYNFTQLQSWSLLAYNMYFSYEFGVILYQWYNGKLIGASNVDGRVIVAAKSIFHCFLTGVSGVLWLWYYFPASEGWEICILFSLHFLFNAKIERLLFGSKRGSIIQMKANSDSMRDTKKPSDDTNSGTFRSYVSTRLQKIGISRPAGIFGQHSSAQSAAEVVDQLEVLDAEAETFLAVRFFTRVPRIAVVEEDTNIDDHAVVRPFDEEIDDDTEKSQVFFHSSAPARVDHYPTKAHLVDMEMEEIV